MEIIDQIIETYRLRQDMIKAATKLQLQAQAIISRASGLGKEDNVSSIFKAACEDPLHEYHFHVLPHSLALEPLENQRAAYEKELVKLVKQLPAYEFVKNTKGFGDLSFACIVGETGDFAKYSNPAKLWKRLGLAVLDGKRQGNPGDKPTAEDWIRHGYNKARRSVVWNAGNNFIGGMGKFRPIYGEDVDANDSYTPYQKLFANRCRLEQQKLNHEIEIAAKTGKESYKLHASNRAKRYVEKRVIRDLWNFWTGNEPPVYGSYA